MKIKKLAAIDIGSNAVRLLINFVYESKGNPPVFNKTSLVRMPIRLGQEVFIDNKISEQTTKRLSKAMKAYRIMMEVYEVEHYLAYATSAMREAENGKEVIQKVREASGLKVEAISGEKEAELIFATELQTFMKDEKTYLYVDVGGGSTELTLLNGGVVKKSESFSVGTVRLLENKVGKDVFSEMKKWIEKNAQNAEIELIGSGGNINHIYKYSETKSGKPLSLIYLKKQYKLIKKMSYEDRLSFYNMKVDRADVIEYALQIYIDVMRWAKAKKIYVPKIGVSDGMIRALYNQVKG